MNTSHTPAGRIWLPVPSELGDFGVVAGEAGLCGVILPELGDSPRSVARLVRRTYPDAHRGSSPLLVLFAEALRLYLTGSESGFDGQLDYGDASPFEQVVWEATRSIPYGETRSYGEVAGRLGSGAVARAVGRANGANPVPIVIPCHRVVGADGSLVGYGGGLEIKAALLRLEGARLPCLRQIPLDL